MPIPVLMPALSPTMTEGNLTLWHKHEGDDVSAGDVIAEIETDKATMEVEAVDEGKLGKILVAEGTENVAVNTPIAMLLEEGEDASSINVSEASAPAAPKTAPDIKQATRPSAPSDPAPSSDKEANGRIFASPLARRIAKDAGIDLGSVTGTGPHGRIVKADVEQAIATPGAARPSTQTPSPATRIVESPLVQPTGQVQELPLSNMRKVIARRLTESKQTIPHFYLTIDCALDSLLGVRKRVNERDDAVKISVNDFIIKAVALAITKKPAVNASWGGDKLFQYHDIDISVAVAIDDGLITPIIRCADQKGLVTISREMKDLAARARENRLKPEEFQGGGFSISNLGMYGIREFSAVINPPQACILAVGAGEQRPVVKNGELAVATVMTCTLSIDHRVVDGALGAEFLAEFKRQIEDPLGLLLH